MIAAKKLKFINFVKKIPLFSLASFFKYSSEER